MSKRLLFCMGEGIGNVIQTIPAIRTITEVLGYTVDYWHAFGSFRVPKIIPYVDRWYVGSQINTVDRSIYEGMIATFWTRQYVGRLGLPLLNKIVPFSQDKYSEVDAYMDAARDLGAGEEDLIWYGECLYKEVEDKYDIVIMDGYNPNGSANWHIKSYPYYPDVVRSLLGLGFSVCSIGRPEEFVEGTINATGRGLLKSAGIIKNSKLLLSNDTGMYHIANALGVPNVVVFTATSMVKNHDKRFHITSHIVGRDDLKCRPCQAQRRWTKDCKTWDCRNISPELIVKKVKEII